MLFWDNEGCTVRKLDNWELDGILLDYYSGILFNYVLQDNGRH